MKLLFITSLKEYQKDVAGILDQADVSIFSVSNTIGFKDHHKTNLLDNWFSSGDEQFDSIFLFSFTDETRANKTLSLIQEYNQTNKNDFPIRVFILPVEKSSY